MFIWLKIFEEKNCPVSLNLVLVQNIWTKSSKSISAAAPCWKQEAMKNDVFPTCTYTHGHRKIIYTFIQFTRCNFIYKLLRCQFHWVQPNRTYTQAQRIVALKASEKTLCKKPQFEQTTSSGGKNSIRDGKIRTAGEHEKAV